jgi:hypothetical protein
MDEEPIPDDAYDDSGCSGAAAADAGQPVMPLPPPVPADAYERDA